jgi:CheY-specific phosphatase CheX
LGRKIDKGLAICDLACMSKEFIPHNIEQRLLRNLLGRRREDLGHLKGQVIVMADHSKWGVVSNFQVASIDEIDTLVTAKVVEVGEITLPAVMVTQILPK